ncbi:MAG TPA: hypothetical protein DEB33_00275 [Gemmatimonadetes bacterium]|nr:hypothetical protein [Gemmatimonadota bacterium]
MAEMKCQQCGSLDAVVHLTQIVNNEMSTHHLCQKCAAEKGLQSGEDPSSNHLLDLIDKMASGLPDASHVETIRCRFCDLTFGEFRKTTRLGCPQCYETFGDQLPRLLRRIHGSDSHVGKIYLPPDPSASEMEKRLEGLHRKLDRAVQVEDFERAAELRDEIGSLALVKEAT